MNDTTDYDVLITGAGLVGASLGAALAGQGLRVAVVETRALDESALDPARSRLLALSLATRRILEGLGLWDGVDALCTPIQQVHVSDRGHFGKTRMSADEARVPALGYVIPSHELTAQLWRGLQASGTTVIAPATVGAVAVGADAATVGLSGDDGDGTVTARLLVAADGSFSHIREQLGIGTRRHDYRQSAIVTTIATERPHANTAWERFTPDGPVALLPYRERMALVWTVPTERADELARLDDETFTRHAQAAFGNYLGRFAEVGARGAHPLQNILADEQVRARVAIIGNAAHTLHPVAAQGFNLGLRDVAWLAEEVVDAARGGRDPGSLEVLEAYLRRRRGDQRRVTAFSGSLVDLFASRVLPVVAGRNLAMAALQCVPPLRHRLMREAMGISGPQPRLARGADL